MTLFSRDGFFLISFFFCLFNFFAELWLTLMFCKLSCYSRLLDSFTVVEQWRYEVNTIRASMMTVIYNCITFYWINEKRLMLKDTNSTRKLKIKYGEIQKEPLQRIKKEKDIERNFYNKKHQASWAKRKKKKENSKEGVWRTKLNTENQTKDNVWKQKRTATNDPMDQDHLKNLYLPIEAKLYHP